MDESAVFVCLASLKWGVLAWALKHHSMDAWRLDTSQIIEWKFILDVAQIEAAEAVPLLENESGVKVMLGNWEPVVKTALRLRSTRLTVLDLKIIGTVGFGMRDSEVDALLRLDLLKVLALKVGDQEFAEQVRLANVNKKVRMRVMTAGKKEKQVSLPTCFLRCWTHLTCRSFGT